VLHSSVSGEGRSVILLHGLFGMGDNLSLVAKVLAENFQVYKLDLRNHGRSPHHDSMSFTEMAADVLSFMDANGIELACVMGHSLGGKVAMQLALDFPDRIERLVVADIAPVDYEGHHDQVFAGIAAVDLPSIESRRQTDEVLKPFIQEDMVRLFILKSLYRTEQGSFAWRLNADALQRCYPQLSAANISKAAFSGPTLFIKGELSAYIQEKHRVTIQRLFPNADLKIIQGAGHYLHVEKSVVFNNLVKRFLMAA
jgi:esterase